MSEFEPRQAREALAWAWWEAIDELRMTVDTTEDPQVRLRACEIILNYATTLNVGIGEPFLPNEPEPDEEYEQDD